jgi:hypothetical protein
LKKQLGLTGNHMWPLSYFARLGSVPRGISTLIDTRMDYLVIHKLRLDRFGNDSQGVHAKYLT